MLVAIHTAQDKVTSASMKGVSRQIHAEFTPMSRPFHARLLMLVMCKLLIEDGLDDQSRTAMSAPLPEPAGVALLVPAYTMTMPQTSMCLTRKLKNDLLKSSCISSEDMPCG
jgi:hypothetical protein